MEQLKTIEICGKPYEMKASMLTAFTYETLYGKDLLEELQTISSNAQNGNIKVVEVLKIAHVMICEQTPNFMSFEDWLKGLTDVLDKPNWVGEVIMLAMSVFRVGKVKK